MKNSIITIIVAFYMIEFYIKFKYFLRMFDLLLMPLKWYF